jgi:hypothetical protein
MITLEQAKALPRGTHLWHNKNLDCRGKPQLWKTTGKPKVWKRTTNKVVIPVKHGLYTFGYVTEQDLYLFCLTMEEAQILDRDAISRGKVAVCGA